MTHINRHRRTRRKASILIVSLVAIFLATAISGLMIQMAGGTRVANISARQQSDTIRCATNLIEFAGQQLKSKLNRPSAQFPQDELKGGFKGPQVAKGDYAAVLGVDTTRYTIAAASWKLNAADASNPVTTNWDNESKDYAPYAAVFAGALNLNNPVNLANPCKNNYIAKIWSIPVSATVTLVDKGTGKRTSLTATCNVQVSYTPFLQYSYYFSGINAQISQGIQTKQRGGIFGNKDINLWTNDTTGYSKGAIIQVDNIAGKNLYFNNLNSGLHGSNNAFNGVYISAGDMNGNGKLDYFADMGKPLSNPYNPYSTTASSILADFLPAFQTPADMGSSRDTYSNNFSYLTSANYSGYQTDRGPQGEQPAATDFSKYYKIDSNNPNITTLSQRFNGNFVDSQTGFKEQYPSTFPTAMTDGTVDAHAMIDPPTSAGRSAASGTTERDVENSKFANNSRFYVLVENPANSTSPPLPPIVFDDPGQALAYKTAAVGLSDSAKLSLRTAYASHIIAVPADVVQVSRSFYDYSQRNYGGKDTVKNIRISAVDINMGSLRNAIGSADAPGAKISMADGSLWNANDSAKGWNGVVYVDVANPKGNGWVSYDKSGNALGYNSTTTDSTTGVPSDPVLTKQSDTKTAIADPLGSADERLVAVRLYNANTVPDRTGATGYSGPAGVTLATNTSVYTVGDINADGDAATDKSYGKSFASPTATAADPKTAPFCIACDSLTAFSSSYYQGDTTHSSLDASDSQLNDKLTKLSAPAVAFHEMNFALISGGADASLRSGGINPAFVINIPVGENRRGLNVRYRGARNVLFPSRYNRKYDNGQGNSYENSNDEAFDQTLRGLNASPPGMPSVKQFSLVNFHLSGS